MKNEESAFSSKNLTFHMESRRLLMWLMMIARGDKTSEEDCWQDMIEVNIWRNVFSIIGSRGNILEGDCWWNWLKKMKKRNVKREKEKRNSFSVFHPFITAERSHSFCASILFWRSLCGILRICMNRLFWIKPLS